MKKYLFAALSGAVFCAAARADAWLPLDVPHGLTEMVSVSFFDARHGFVGGYVGGNAYTDDGGATWRLGNPAGEGTANVVLALSADSALFARNALYRTVNRGADWTRVTTLDPGVTIFDLVRTPGGRIAMLRGLDIWTSDDAGLSWTQRFGDVDTQYFLRHLSAPDAQHLIAVGGRPGEGHSIGHLARSHDGGLTWEAFTTATPQIFAADFSDATHGLVATLTGDLYATADAGSHFTLVENDLPFATIVMDLRRRDSGAYYAATLDGDLWRSRDGGHHWEPRYRDAEQRAINGLSLHDGGAIAVGSGNLMVGENELFVEDFEPTTRDR